MCQLLCYDFVVHSIPFNVVEMYDCLRPKSIRRMIIKIDFSLLNKPLRGFRPALRLTKPSIEWGLSPGGKAAVA
jgi:hypothetical protein